MLARVDDGAGRFLARTLCQQGDNACPVYAHAKIAIVDDGSLTVGSANLNEHSLFNDTEMNIVTREADLVRQTRIRLWSEHLDVPVAELQANPTDIVDTKWRPIAEAQLRLRRDGEPLTLRLVRLPRVSRRRDALRGPLNGLLVGG